MSADLACVDGLSAHICAFLDLDARWGLHNSVAPAAAAYPTSTFVGHNSQGPLRFFRLGLISTLQK